jgi:uncharacterized protein
MGVFVLVALVLESGGLYDWAQRLDLGPERNVAVPVTAALHRVLAPLRVEKERRRVLVGLAKIGWSDDPALLAEAAAPAGTMPMASAIPTAVASVSSVGAKSEVVSVPPAVGAAPRDLHLAPILAEAPPKLSVLPKIEPVAAEKMRTVALAGDSMMAVGLYSTLHRLAPQYPDVMFVNAFKSGTGLARPEVFNWQTEYPAMLKGMKPDYVVVAIGANDGQGFVEDGVTYPFGSDGWKAIYERRVQEYLAMLQSTGATVVWLGLPPMKSGVYDEKIAWVNRIFYSVVTATPHAIWFSTTGVIGDGDGKFRDFGEVDGKTVKLRQADGIHMSDDGASLIVAKLLPWIAAQASAAAPVAATSEVKP